MQVVAVRLDQVGRRFGAQVALRRVSLTLRAGEITLLLGPNGAGKTTLLRILATLVRPSRGAVKVMLRPASDAPAKPWPLEAIVAQRRDLVGLVSHASLLYDDLTAAENLALFARLYGLAPARVEARSAQLLDDLGLTYARDRRVADFSRGMRQRLSIARALLQAPPLLLLDEPFTGLDRQGRATLHAVLRDLRASGALIVLITHALDQPPDLIDRAVLLDGGRVVADAALDGAPLGPWYERHLSGAPPSQ